MNFNLPDDIMIQIYSFLDWKDVAKIENNKNILMTLIKLENPGKKVFHEKFYRNLFKNQCFNCYSELNMSYLLKICSNCKFIVNNKDFFPMYCGCCIPRKKNRNFETRICSYCELFCAFIGIEPFS